MHLITRLQRISEVFFFLFGCAYLLAFLLWRNAVLPYETEVFLRLGDLPLLFFGILYGLTSLYRSFVPERREKSFTGKDMMLIGVVLVLFGGVVCIDIFVPRVMPFPDLS